jgi:hypothetical protein
MSANLKEEPVVQKLGNGLSSILPIYKLEYTDGTNWYSLVTENLLNMTVKLPVIAATTSNLNATYSNGSSGVGATLTNAGTQAALVIDGVTLSVGQRVLVLYQTSQVQNGVYTVTNAGSASTNWVLTRATDYDSLYLINPGNVIVVASGTVNGTTSWMQNSAQPTAIGTSNITFVTLSKPGVSSVVGTTNQISVVTASGVATVSITANPVIPGTAGMTIPGGSIAQRPGTPTAGTLRFNNGT